MSEQESAASVPADASIVADVAEQPSGAPHPLRRVVWLLAMAVFVYVMVVEVILAIGFVCLLFGIEPASWFVDVVYRSVDRTMQPFRWIFTAIEFGTGSNEEVQPRIESAMVFAMIVYGIIALAAHDLAEWVGRPRRSGAAPT
ncbi:hypothetical protein [Ilumatobacter sp.]|uniref:hypothetical protein n=1 Tax=Ilumatobacter sp. TaxID=1967498 RepID=UPI003AF5AEF5